MRREKTQYGLKLSQLQDIIHALGELREARQKELIFLHNPEPKLFF